MQNKNQCKNCAQPITADVAYCPRCGQEAKLAKVSVLSFLANFFSDFFSYDNRFVNSMNTLLIPGELTQQYFDGKRKRYHSPLRFFIVVSFFFAFVLSAVFKNSELAYKIRTQGDQFNTEVRDRYVYLQVDTFLMEASKEYPDNRPIIDTLRGNFEREFLKYDGIDSSSLENIKVSLAGANIHLEDYNRLSNAQFEKRYLKDKSWLQRTLIVQFKKIIEQGDRFIQYFIGQVGITIIFFIPVFSLLLWLFYYRKRRYYVEHLIFNYHFHVFAFLVAAVLLILYDLTGKGVVFQFGALLLLVYLTIAVKRFYRQGWAKTILKVFLASIAYFFILVFVFGVTFFLTFSTF